MRISALLAGLRIIKSGDCTGRVFCSHPQQDIGLAGRMGSAAKKRLLTLVHPSRSMRGLTGRQLMAVTEGLNAGGLTLRVGTCN
jgi:hypothetical protein